MQIHYELHPKECTSCDFTMEITSRYHRLFIYDVKRNTKIEGMGPTNPTPNYYHIVLATLECKNASEEQKV